MGYPHDQSAKHVGHNVRILLLHETVCRGLTWFEECSIIVTKAQHNKFGTQKNIINSFFCLPCLFLIWGVFFPLPVRRSLLNNFSLGGEIRIPPKDLGTTHTIFYWLKAIFLLISPILPAGNIAGQGFIRHVIHGDQLPYV
jgi:hypothetical protein